MSLISCPSRRTFSHFFAIHGHRSRDLIQRMVPCVTNGGSHRGARWTKPWKVGDPKLWAKGVMDYRYKEARRDKVAKVKIPNFDEMRMKRNLEQSPEEMRSFQKERGIVPPRPWNERPITMTHTNTVFDPYVPKEGDERKSLVSIDGMKQVFQDKLSKKTTSYYALRKIRSFIEGFDPKYFAMNEASEIYFKVHEMICILSNCENNSDLEIEDEIFDFVTEKAYAEIVHNIERKTICWKVMKTLEEPYCVRVRCEKGMDGTDLWAQVTIRFHSQQILAIYDRFGRLMAGSENIVKDVLEYVVFENHISDIYGRWRIHGKIIPDWIKSSPSYSSTTAYATYRKPTVGKGDDEEKKEEEEGKEGEKKSGKKEWRPFVTGRKLVEV